MGWGSGAELADKLWRSIYDRLPDCYKKEIAREWVHIFEQEDCDQMLETIVGEAAGIECNEQQGSHWGAWYNK